MSRAVGRRVPGLGFWAAEVWASVAVLLRRISERGGAGFFCPNL